MAKKRSIKKLVLWIVIAVLAIAIVGFVFISMNLNRLITNALNNGFAANQISDVYELKFEGLDVNVLSGSVKVLNVKMYPRDKPLNDYPYINSSFVLEAKKMILRNVGILKLLLSNKLHLEKIELVEPGINFTIADLKPVFFPFKESASPQPVKKGKKAIGSYELKEFSMVDAYFHVINSAKLREFNIRGINISLKDMVIDQQPGVDKISYKHFDFAVGEMTGNLQSKSLRYIYFKDLKVSIDSLAMEETKDTVIYHFADINTGIKNLDVQTADSLYHLTLESFDLNYKKNSIEFKNLSFKPNISDAAMQTRNTYRKEHFAAEIKSIQLNGFNFDSLVYAKKLFIDEIELKDVSAAIYKDLTKPFPPDHHPEYLGQQIQAISMPINIKHIKASKVDLVNTEVKPDGSIGKANLNRVSLELENLTSLPSNEMLSIKADAYVENKAHAHLQLKFNYNEPQFSIDGHVDKFDLTDLNALTNSYAPARIKQGIADGITFSGMVYKTHSTGTMKFLYHDLVVDMELEDKAKWKSTLLGFAANTYLASANPASENLPVREVHFEVERDPRKGFMSMLIKSILDGVKETFIMSKENKQAYHEAKADLKTKNKAEKKN